MNLTTTMQRVLTALLLFIPGFVFAQTEIRVTDADIDGDVTWTAENVYILEGRVFVEEGETLTIEAGTVVKGAPGEGENASVLIVARGGQLFAEGTASNPIIFTAEADDVSDPTDLTAEDNGEWGGLIILGRASTNLPTNEGAVEGIPTTETRALFGGDDDDDNSGVVRYVSIRHGGAVIGADNEINGLTLGGVGRGTTIEYVEVFANLDDGFEWFGGTVDSRYLVSAFNGDESFDTDLGWRGRNQFWFAIQGDESGNWLTENDGGDKDLGETSTPFATPVIYNATLIGSGVGGNNPDNDGAFRIRENSRISWINSIITDVNGTGVDVQDRDSGEDSRSGLENGDLRLQNNLWFGFADGNGIEAIAGQDFVQTYLTDVANGNRIEDPLLNNISRAADGTLDPRPSAGSPALTGAAAPEDDFFEGTEYVGAFSTADNWAAGWTALSNLGFVATAAEEDRVPGSGAVPATFALGQNYPNPFNPSTNISFTLQQAQDVRLTVHDVLGREVQELFNGLQAAGSHTVAFDAIGLPSGVYFYRLEATGQSVTKKMLLLK